MLVFGWLLFGLAGLFAVSAVLSLGQKAGTYVSPYGAFRFLITGHVDTSTWPWGQASVSGFLTKTLTDAAALGILGSKLSGSSTQGGGGGGEGGGEPPVDVEPVVP